MKRPFYLLKSLVILNLCHLKKATEKARVLKQEFYFKIHKVYSSMKMSVNSYLFVLLDNLFC